MAASCSDDPMICIDFAVTLIGEFLKDWTTMGMMALLLVLLLKLRDDQRKARAEAYAAQMSNFDDQRKTQGKAKTWEVNAGSWVER